MDGWIIGLLYSPRSARVMLFFTANMMFSAVWLTMGLLPSAWKAPGTGIRVGARYARSESWPCRMWSFNPAALEIVLISIDHHHHHHHHHHQQLQQQQQQQHEQAVSDGIQLPESPLRLIHLHIVQLARMDSGLHYEVVQLLTALHELLHLLLVCD